LADSIGVLLVDDHLVVRQGLRAFLEVQEDIRVVGEAGDGARALALIDELRPDVVLLDLQMPGMDGVAVLRAMRERGDAARVLVVTSFTQPEAVLPAMRAGAAGYVYKDVEPSSLAQGIRSVHAGQTLLADDVAAVLVAGEERTSSVGLTDREGDVLREIAHGRSNREIARALVVSEKTVKTHVSNILLKLGVQDRTQAALWAVRNGVGGGSGRR
jgi:DNA-binding NarL/FixJ family response regulator